MISSKAWRPVSCQESPLSAAQARLRDSLPAQVLHGLVIHDYAVIAHDAIMAVAVVRVQRHVCVNLQENTTIVSKLSIRQA